MRRSLQVRGPKGLVASHLRTAFTPWSRLRGLLGRPKLHPDEGLVIQPCRRVHTYGMRYPIDAIFLDEGGRVLHVETLGPRSTSRHIKAALSCIELLGGRAAALGIEPGVRLAVDPT